MLCRMAAPPDMPPDMPPTCPRLVKKCALVNREARPDKAHQLPLALVQARAAPRRAAHSAALHAGRARAHGPLCTDSY